MNEEGKELVSILLMMGVLFIFALGGVALFFRQWRKEQAERFKAKRESKSEEKPF